MPRSAASAPRRAPSFPVDQTSEAPFEDRVVGALSALTSASERIESELAALAAALHRLGESHPAVAFDGLAAKGSKEPGGLGDEFGPSASIEGDARASKQLDQLVAPWLPQGWPVVLRLRRQVKLSSMRTSTQMLQAAESVSRLSSRTQSASGRLLHSSHKAFRQAFISPNSKLHIAYSVISLLIVVFEITLVPVVLAWDVALTGWLQVFAWGTPTFWTVDIAVNFCTGIYRAGELVMDWKSVAFNYCTSWLPLDILVVACDWVSLAIGMSSGDTIKILRFSKLGRIIRVVGIMRMVRVIRILEEAADMWLSEGSQLACRMVSIFLSIMWAAHFLSCFWFFIGMQSEISDTGASWFDGAAIRVQGEPLSFFDAGVVYQYSVSLHWAISQISLGAIDTMPSNTAERLVFVFSTMMGFLFGSMLISLMSAGIVDYRINKRDKVNKMRGVRRYLEENSVNHTIATAVVKQIEQRLSIQEKLNEHDVPALNLLSRVVRSQLRFDLSKACFQSHPLFRLWISIDETAMQRMCDEATSVRHLRASDELFSAGAEGVAAFVVSYGRLSYTGLVVAGTETRDAEFALSDMESAVEVGVDDWISEAALWVEWTHTGRLDAVTESRILAIDPELMYKQLFHPAVKSVAVEYAEQFHRRIVDSMPPFLPVPSDLAVPGTSYCALVCSMPRPMQQMIGLQALQHLTAWESQARTRMEHEINEGRSVVVVNSEGSVRRAVSLVALRLVGPDGDLLVQVGSFDVSGYEPCCQLPWAVREASETVGESLERLVASKLGRLLADKAELDDVTEEISEKKFKSIIPTWTVRMVCSARLKADTVIDAPSVPHRASGDASTAFRKGLSRSGSVGFSRQGTLQEFQGYQHRSVWAVPAAAQAGSDAWECYAWVSPEEFSVFSSGSKGEAALAHWFSLLEPPEAITDDDNGAKWVSHHSV